MLRKITHFLLLMMVFSIPAQAQHTIYGLRFDNGFLTRKTTYTVGVGDTMTFDALRYYIYHADGTQERGNYARVSEFYLHQPPIALYRPNYMRSIDFTDESSQWCFARSMESDHFIVFWEAGFGLNPKKAAPTYAFDPADLLARAEKAYKVYTTDLGFIDPATSETLKTYKIEIFVHYTTTWRATGSGVDFKAGTLDVNHDAAKTLVTTAHEIGHTFQYMISCDFEDPRNHGWQWGFDDSATGLCAWWESCAQWQAYKVYPEREFIESWETYIYIWSHLNLLHERMRYYNFFVQDYWCQLHGQDFIGRLWRESERPEDPVEAYCRLTETSHDDFCRDMYDYACRAITWDIDALRQTGSRRTDRFTTQMHAVEGDWWQVDSATCPQNYGFNVIRLSVPTAGTEVSAEFQGMAGAAGYRAIKTDKAGWCYGFVALQEDGTRVYGPMNTEAASTATFAVPANTVKLWFVVLGAPTEHWHHPWDMKDDNFTAADLADDEQWPYRVRFTGTRRQP